MAAIAGYDAKKELLMHKQSTTVNRVRVLGGQKRFMSKLGVKGSVTDYQIKAMSARFWVIGNWFELNSGTRVSGFEISL